MSSQPQIILVTGANRGIGLAVIHSLAIALPSSTLLLGCRELAKGEATTSNLRAQGITSTIHHVKLDVTNDDSVKSAVDFATREFGSLDVPINNAGCAFIPPDPDTDPQGYRTAFQSVYDVNVTSVAFCTALFLPLLRKSPDGRVINVSSGRASMQILTSGEMPPTVSFSCSISKVALNALTVETSRYEENRGVLFAVVAPGHCRTGLNGWSGKRDPMEGARVVVECVRREREEVGNAMFWETRGAGRELVSVPW